MAFSTGDTVSWKWGDGSASGKIEKIYTRKITLKIKGSDVTRDADEDCPAYKIKQDDGDVVLKSQSELSKA